MPKKYVKTGKTPEGTARRMRAYYHNRLMGYAVMSRRKMLEILNSDTATEEAADIAATIVAHLQELAEALKTRRD